MSGSDGRRWPFVSSGAADASTSLSSDWRKLGPLQLVLAFASGVLGRRGIDDAPADLLLEVDGFAEASDDDSARSCARLVRGLFSRRSGSVGSTTSDGEVVADFRFLLLGLGCV